MASLLVESLKHFKEVGTIFQTSATLVEKAVQQSKISDAQTVVELGTGTGNTTERILNQMQGDGNYIGFEINKNFVEQTRQRCPQARIYHKSAAHLPQVLAMEGIAGVDVVFSTLPWTLFSQEEQQNLLETINNHLNPEGEFITLAYYNGLMLPSGRKFRQLLKSKFGGFNTSQVIWKNVPPAIYYQAYKG